MIVELIGPNGAGKETLASEVAQAGVADVVTMQEPPPVRPRVALARNARFAVAALRAGLYRDRARLASVARRDAALGSLQPGTRPTLVDEGPRHWLLSHCARGLLPANEAPFRSLRRPDRIVFVHAPVEVCVERLTGKPAGHWTHHLDDEALARVLERYVALAEQVVGRAGVEVVRVDTSSDGDAARNLGSALTVV